MSCSHSRRLPRRRAALALWLATLALQARSRPARPALSVDPTDALPEPDPELDLDSVDVEDDDDLLDEPLSDELLDVFDESENDEDDDELLGFDFDDEEDDGW